MRTRQAFILAILWTFVAVPSQVVAQGAICSELALDPSHPLHFDSLDVKLGLSRVATDFSAQRFYEKRRALEVVWAEFVTANKLSGRKISDFSNLVGEYVGRESPESKWMTALPGRGQVVNYDIPGRDDRDARFSLDCEGAQDDPNRLAIRHFAHSLEKYDYEETMKGRALNLSSEGVTAVYRTHEQKFENGLPMWPWEHFVNGVSPKKDWDKTKSASLNQYIVLRPSIAPALRFSGVEDSQVDLGIALEVAGMIRYKQGSQFKKWQGGSLIATITEDNGVGFGAMYRNQSLLIGAARHNKTDDWMLYLSVDFYRLIIGEGETTNRADEFLNRLAKFKVDELRGN